METAYERTITTEVRLLLGRFAEKSEEAVESGTDVKEEMEMFAAAIIADVLYAHKIRDGGDSFLTIARASAEAVGLLGRSVGAALADLLPSSKLSHFGFNTPSFSRVTAHPRRFPFSFITP